MYMCIGNVLKIQPDQVPSYCQALVPCALQKKEAKFTQGKGSLKEKNVSVGDFYE